MNELENLEQRLRSLGCLASVQQIKDYLDLSGKSPGELQSMGDNALKLWFSKCLDQKYYRHTVRINSGIVN